MKVHLVTPEDTTAHRDNIKFLDGGPWPRKWGEWPEGHPCAVGAGLEALSRFRAAGYSDASCYPEGDGLCYSRPAGKTRADVIADIEGIFGWQVAAEDVQGKLDRSAYLRLPLQAEIFPASELPIGQRSAPLIEPEPWIRGGLHGGHLSGEILSKHHPYDDEDDTGEDW